MYSTQWEFNKHLHAALYLLIDVWASYSVPGVGGMEKKVRENAVYISLLPDDTTEEKLAEYFGSIGVIKVL